MRQAIFVAATAQHVGKTTACLGIISGLMKRYGRVGFIKPVGQEQVEAEESIHVDKDVLLFRDCFKLNSDWVDMSPVLIPAGFTRRYLDGKIHREELVERINRGFQRISSANDFTVVEGTGHAGVGSIIELSNADVAKQLQLEVVLISAGGLGNAFDQLAVNKAMFEAAGVKVRAIIVNRVLPEKREMILEYVSKALKRWDTPLAGCIPYSPLLDAPAMCDFSSLFGQPLISGEEHLYRHFTSSRLVATTVDEYRAEVIPEQLIITHVSREDVIMATVADDHERRLERGMILAGRHLPSPGVVEALREAKIPAIHAPVSSYQAMKMIAGFTAKIGRKDVCKVKQAIDLMERHIDFEVLLS
jgi:phosphate acetyltransferase